MKKLIITLIIITSALTALGAESAKDIIDRMDEVMDFGVALMNLKEGHRVARKGWNGKGMYVFLATGVNFRTEADLSEFNPTRTEEFNELNAVEVGDVLVLRTAQGTLQPGWLASQADMLAEDWVIL